MRRRKIKLKKKKDFIFFFLLTNLEIKKLFLIIKKKRQNLMLDLGLAIHKQRFSATTFNTASFYYYMYDSFIISKAYGDKTDGINCRVSRFETDDVLI
jgi:hypothetical protein